MTGAVKSDLEILRLASAARTLFPLFSEIADEVWVDRSGLELDRFVARYLQRRGLESALEGYRSYEYRSSISINATAVHGLPSDRPFSRGDLFTVDVAASAGGYVSDTAWTYVMPGASRRAIDLYRRSWAAYRELLASIRIGMSLAALADAASTAAHGQGVAIVPSLLGHGIGKSIHEQPVLSFVPSSGTAADDILLAEGMVLNIEPVYTDGSGEIIKLDDGWAIATSDRASTVHFELTVEINGNGPRVLQWDGAWINSVPKEVPFGYLTD